MSDLTAAILFLVVVGLMVVVGVVVGIIVAGRMDRLMTPRPTAPARDRERVADDVPTGAGNAEEELP